MTQEQYAADIRNWLADLAIGAKAMMRSVRYEDGKSEYTHSARTYNHDEVEKNGIAIHDLCNVCCVAHIEYTFVPVGGYPKEHKIAGHWTFEFNGVRFFDLVRVDDKEYKKWKKEHNDDGK